MRGLSVGVTDEKSSALEGVNDGRKSLTADVQSLCVQPPKESLPQLESK
jgi:hypothetical protein